MQMKAENIAGLLLGLVIGTAGFRLWQQQQEIDTWRSRATVAAGDLARRTAERDILEQRLHEQAATAPKSSPPPATTEDQGVSNPERPKKSEPAPFESAKLSGETLKQWLADADNPTVLRRLNLQAQNRTLQRYGDLFKLLELSPAQTDQFAKLLTDKRQAAMDVAVTSYQRGEDPTQNLEQYRAVVDATRQEIEGQINALLGDDKYAQYHEYDLIAGQSNVLNNLQLALQRSAEPLTAEQAERFKAVLQESNATRITTRVINDSREILSPTQLRALQDLRAVQQANAQKRNAPVQYLPTTPEVPEPKPAPAPAPTTTPPAK